MAKKRCDASAPCSNCCKRGLAESCSNCDDGGLLTRPTREPRLTPQPQSSLRRDVPSEDERPLGQPSRPRPLTDPLQPEEQQSGRQSPSGPANGATAATQHPRMLLSSRGEKGEHCASILRPRFSESQLGINLTIARETFSLCR
jgi:hypothetical protein